MMFRNYSYVYEGVAQVVNMLDGGACLRFRSEHCSISVTGAGTREKLFRETKENKNRAIVLQKSLSADFKLSTGLKQVLLTIVPGDRIRLTICQDVDVDTLGNELHSSVHTITLQNLSAVSAINVHKPLTVNDFSKLIVKPKRITI